MAGAHAITVTRVMGTKPRCLFRVGFRESIRAMRVLLVQEDWGLTAKPGVGTGPFEGDTTRGGVWFRSETATPRLRNGRFYCPEWDFWLVGASHGGAGVERAAGVALGHVGDGDGGI